jgi:hypothetical protein
MKHRYWLLAAAAGALLYAFVLIRLDLVLSFYVTYGEADISASTAFAIACVLAWAALEVIHAARAGRAGKCACGYSLQGVKCPECGKDLGSGQP